jgi:CO/xanthine dehydrogenase Mo-binding subunit
LPPQNCAPRQSRPRRHCCSHAEELDLVNGKVVSKTGSGASVTLGEVARALVPALKFHESATPGLFAEGWFEARDLTYPYGIQVAVVCVDRETGAVAVEHYFVAYDIGKAVNPMLVEGQLVGSVRTVARRVHHRRVHFCKNSCMFAADERARGSRSE